MASLTWTVIGDFIVEYLWVIVVIAIIGAYILLKQIQKNKAKKKEAMSKGLGIRKMGPTPTLPQKKDEIVQQEILRTPVTKPAERGLGYLFGEGPTFEEQETELAFTEKLTKLNADLAKEGTELDTKLVKDFDDLRKQLNEVAKKREQVKEYGLKLAALYDKYRTREYHLVNMMRNIEQMQQKKQ